MKPHEAHEALDPQAELAALRARVAQLECAQRELETFTSAVAHDLRTPLSAVDGFCALLQDTLADMPGEPARSCVHYAARVQAGLQHMGEMVDALLALARTSQVVLRPEPVDLSGLAGEALDGLQAREPERSCRCRVQPGLQAWGDRTLLRQVLENLLGNAWKFSARRDSVEIEVGRQPDAQGGAFFVRDHGAGFDMEQAGRLFQPFERLHSAAEFPGTGMGLATVRRILARHGGQIRVQSAPGQGATFFFTLGAPDARAQPGPTP
jgi:signal transduction histidine kinase